MANKIIFGDDLIKVLEKEYKLNKLGEVPTKYKSGVTTIDFIYGKEKDIDDLKYNKPYVEFSIDDETDGFISGTMYLNGGVEGIQFDSWEDLKYFMKNAKWTESMKEEMDTSVVGTNKDKTKKYAYDFLKEWYENIVVESLMNDDGDYVLKVGFYDNLLKKDPSIMDKVSAKLSGNSRFLQMLDDDTACKLVVYDVNNPRKYEVYWL